MNKTNTHTLKKITGQSHAGFPLICRKRMQVYSQRKNASQGEGDTGWGWMGMEAEDLGVAISKPSPITVGMLSGGVSFPRKQRIDGQDLQTIFTSYCFLFKCTSQQLKPIKVLKQNT